MRYHDPLDVMLSQLSKVRVLRFLLIREGERGGREIARSVGLSHPIVHRSLQELATHGVVVSRRAGGAVFYRANPDHWLVKELLRPLFSKERESLQALGAFLLQRLREPDVSFFLFGSVARAEDGPGSDVDLLVIVTDSRRKEAVEARIFELAPDATRVFGNRLAPVVLTRAEFRERFRRGERWLKAALREGQVIAGKPLTELVSRHGA